jgi:hypothetical protein
MEICTAEEVKVVQFWVVRDLDDRMNSPQSESLFRCICIWKVEDLNAGVNRFSLFRSN